MGLPIFYFLLIVSDFAVYSFWFISCYNTSNKVTFYVTSNILWSMKSYITDMSQRMENISSLIVSEVKIAFGGINQPGWIIFILFYFLNQSMTVYCILAHRAELPSFPLLPLGWGLRLMWLLSAERKKSRMRDSQTRASNLQCVSKLFQLLAAQQRLTPLPSRLLRGLRGGISPNYLLLIQRRRWIQSRARLSLFPFCLHPLFLSSPPPPPPPPYLAIGTTI